MATVAQDYIAEHGEPPQEEESIGAQLGVTPYVTQLGHWDGKGKLAKYSDLASKLTQKYRLFGEECIVVGCTQKIDAPKYVMELIGAPTCMECGQKIALDQLHGTKTFPFQYEMPTPEEIKKCREAGVTMPAYGE